MRAGECSFALEARIRNARRPHSWSRLAAVHALCLRSEHPCSLCLSVEACERIQKFASADRADTTVSAEERWINWGPTGRVKVPQYLGDT